jgi:outer membrane protein TolC
MGAALTSRSLQDEGLRRFLVENLGPAAAAPRAEWDFDSLAWVAFYFNPTLDVARAQWEAAHAAVTTAGARPNPTLSLVPGYNTNPDAGISPWFPAISADFLFSTAGKTGHRVAAAKFADQSARYDVLAAVWKARGDLRQALLERVAAERRHAALQNQTTVQQRVLTLLEQRLQAGAISSAELATTRVALVRAQNDLADSQRLSAAALQHVAQALGLPVEAISDLKCSPPAAPESLTGPALVTARRVALQSRADVLSGLARYQAAEEALAEQLALQYPDFHLGPGYQWDQGANKWSLALTFELPVFNHNQGPIAEAVARRKEAAAQVVLVQSQVIAEIDAAASAQASATDRSNGLMRLQDALTRQQASLRARLAAGSADQLEVSTAELEIAAGQLALLDAQAQTAQAAGQMEDALQVPFARLETLIAPSRAATSTSSP